MFCFLKQTARSCFYITTEGKNKMYFLYPNMVEEKHDFAFSLPLYVLTEKNIWYGDRFKKLCCIYMDRGKNLDAFVTMIKT